MGVGKKNRAPALPAKRLPGQSKFLEILGDFVVPALLRKSQRGLAVVGARMRVRTVRDQYFDNVETTVGNSLQQWRMTFAVTVVHVRAILREPFDDRSMSARNRSR